MKIINIERLLVLVPVLPALCVTPCLSWAQGITPGSSGLSSHDSVLVGHESRLTASTLLPKSTAGVDGVSRESVWLMGIITVLKVLTRRVSLQSSLVNAALLLSSVLAHLRFKVLGLSDFLAYLIRKYRSDSRKEFAICWSVSLESSTPVRTFLESEYIGTLSILSGVTM